MDVTEMILAMGQQIESNFTTEPKEGFYDTQTVSPQKGNRAYISEAFPSFESYMQTQEYISEKGLTKCLQFKFGYIRSPYARVFRRWVSYLKDSPYTCKVNKYTLIEPDDDAMEAIDIQLDE